MLLESSGFVVMDAETADDGRQNLDDSVDAVLLDHTVGVQDTLWLAQQAKAMGIKVCVLRKPISALPRGLSVIDAYLDFMCEPAKLIDCFRTLIGDK